MMQTNARVPGIVERCEVVSYARFSSDLQNEQSIPDQERLHVEKCIQLGLPAPSITFRDAARSGASMVHRDGLRALLAHAAKPAPPGFRRVLVIESLDRLGRNIYDSFSIVGKLHREAGFRIVTCDGRDSDTPAFKAMLLADSFVADVFLDNLRTHVRRSIDARVAQGRWVTRIPLGYRIVEGRLVIDPERARVVQRMFELAASGLAIRAIADRMYGEHLTAEHWSGGALSNRLHRRIYIGEVWYDDKLVRRDETLRIVSEETWKAVHAALNSRGAVAAKMRQPGSNLVRGGTLARHHLLSGLFTCADCGKPLAVLAGNRLPQGVRSFYRCPNAFNHHSCANRLCVTQSILDEVVVNEVVRTILDGDAVDEVVRDVQRRVAAGDSERVAERQRLGRELADAHRRLKHCVAHIEAHGGSITMQERIAALEAEARGVEARLERLDRAASKVAVLRPAVETYLSRSAELLRTKDPARMRDTLRQLIVLGTVARLKRGTYRVTMKIAPLGVLQEVVVTGSKGR